MGTLTGTDIIVRNLGVQPYEKIYQQMRSFHDQRTVETADEIWLLEHNPVYTLGRNGKREHILSASDIPVVQIDRGGQVTYHAPGQLVMYTLIDLKRRKIAVKQWVHHLESSVINMLSTFGVVANNDPKAPGVYVKGKKVAALGLRISRGRCYHGLSVNIDMDLSPFNTINPCGYKGLEVTQCTDLGISEPFKIIQEVLLKEVASYPL